YAAAVDTTTDNGEIEEFIHQVGDELYREATVGTRTAVHPIALVQSWLNSPDLPPALWVRRSASMRMPRSTDLHISYTVSAATDAAVSASISTPVCPVVCTV